MSEAKKTLADVAKEAYEGNGATWQQVAEAVLAHARAEGAARGGTLSDEGVRVQFERVEQPTRGMLERHLAAQGRAIAALTMERASARAGWEDAGRLLGQVIALRSVDMGAGETLNIPPDLAGHAAVSAMLATMRERDEARATIAAKDARIAELESERTEDRKRWDLARGEIKTVRERASKAEDRACAAESAMATLRQNVDSLCRAIRADMAEVEPLWMSERARGALEGAERAVASTTTEPPDHIPQTDGFLGVRSRIVGTLTDGQQEHAHTMRLAMYRFPDGSEAPCVEVVETGGQYVGGRVLALSTAVHALRNLGEMEVYQVGNRAGPSEHPDTAMREDYPPVARARRVVLELEKMLAPYAAGEEGSRDVVARVRRLLRDVATLRAIRERANALRTEDAAAEIRAAAFAAEPYPSTDVDLVRDAVAEALRRMLGDSGPSGGGESVALTQSIDWSKHAKGCRAEWGVGFDTHRQLVCAPDYPSNPTTPPDAGEAPLDAEDKARVDAAWKHYSDAAAKTPARMDEPTPTPEEDWRRVIKHASDMVHELAERDVRRPGSVAGSLAAAREHVAALARLKDEPRRAAAGCVVCSSKTDPLNQCVHCASAIEQRTAKEAAGRAAEAMRKACVVAIQKRACYIAPEDDRSPFAAKLVRDIERLSLP